MNILIVIIIGIICVEISITAIVRFFRREFQWLVIKGDERPDLDEAGLQKFLEHGFDPLLGWIRKPNTTGYDKIPDGKVQYNIDHRGARRNEIISQKSSLIATFGDSYTFCRQVSDNETWQAHMSKTFKADVLNFGVGNYGVDQALLRYENTKLPSSIKISILGFVPETICRIHSYWKHYLEFGNTFAFKPRFAIEEGKLVLHPNLMQSINDFRRYREKLTQINRIDGFYKTKFRSLQFRFPYLFSFLRHPDRNSKLIYTLVRRKWARLWGLSSLQIENDPFRVIMAYNLWEAHNMYQNKLACGLLKEILVRFKQKAEERGHYPVILVMPQLIDVKIYQDGINSYPEFFSSLDIGLPVWDLTKMISSQNLSKFYTEDLYGGHFSKLGNEVVAEHLTNKLFETFPTMFQGNVNN